jgi:hypothetical protein
MIEVPSSFVGKKWIIRSQAKSAEHSANQVNFLHRFMDGCEGALLQQPLAEKDALANFVRCHEHAKRPSNDRGFFTGHR